ncbi:methyltransferase domain-containing protein [Coxiella-like endosymbiont]
MHSSHVIHYIQNPEKVLNRFKRMLKSGGDPRTCNDL